MEEEKEAARALGLTLQDDMEEGDKPGEVVDDQVATGDVGDNEDEDKDELSVEEQKALEADDDEEEDE